MAPATPPPRGRGMWVSRRYLADPAGRRKKNHGGWSFDRAFSIVLSGTPGAETPMERAERT